MLQRPTVQQMNDDNDAVRDQLLLLRILCTSDLAFTYHLLKKSTLENLIDNAAGFVEMNMDILNADEMREFNDLYKQIREYCNSPHVEV